MPYFDHPVGRARRTFFRVAVALVAPLLLAGCHTANWGFAPRWQGWGDQARIADLDEYVDTAQVGENLYRVTVQRGAPLGQTDSAMLHAAMMTQSRGCHYFSFVRGDLGSRMIAFREPQSQTAGPRMLDPGRVVGIFIPVPGAGGLGTYTVSCFREKPNDLVHEAALVAADIRDRYGLP